MKKASFFDWVKGKISKLVCEAEKENSSSLTKKATNKAGDKTVKTYKATGMAYRLDNLLRLGVKNEEYSKSKKELIEDGQIGESVWEFNFCPSNVELIPEPDNPHDPNAIKVVVDGAHVAYIKKGSCAHLLKVIKENRIEKIECEIAGGQYKYVVEEYNDDGKKTYLLEKDNAPHFVHLHITEKC